MVYNETELKNVLARVFRISADSITEETAIGTTENWDSLNHLNLVLALEEQFGVSFTDQETVEILSYPLIKLVLAEHNVLFC